MAITFCAAASVAHHFVQQLQKDNQRITGFSEEAVELLRQYSWPGNIRELRNAIERGLALAQGNVISTTDLPQSLRRIEAASGPQVGAKLSAASRADTLDDAERDYLVSLLKKNSGNLSQCAVQVGMSRQG